MTFDSPLIPRRLLMTTDTVGGVWTYALELTRALAPHGVRVSLAAMGGPLSPEQRAEASALSSLEVHESDFRLEWMEDPWEDVGRAGEWLLGLERRVRPEVLHLNGYAHGALPRRAPALVVGHSCVLSWWQACRGGAAPECWDRYRREVTSGLRAADLVVAPTRAMLSELERHYGPLPPRRVIPNGRPPGRFFPGRKEGFILTAGRLWDEAKNVAALEAAAPGLPWPVCVAGEAQHPDGGLARPRNVVLLGRLSPAVLAGWYARAAIYALPARYEPFGLSALEAGLAGCALVLGDIPTLREVWGGSAHFVDPRDPGELAAALRRLIESPDLRREMGAAARQRALEYTPERMALGYLLAYQDLLRARDEAPETAEAAEAAGAAGPASAAPPR